MCGIFGIYSTEALTSDEKGLFSILGIFSAPRGRDATGFLATETAGFRRPGRDEPETMYIIHKEPVEPYVFFQMKRIQDELKSRNNCLMGHCRHATVGEKIAESAHPFEHGSTIGMHNGTIRGYATKDDYSDSDRLYKRIDEIGFREAMTELPRDSAYALTWWDMDTNEYCFFRNSQRPIVYCTSKDGKKVLWASEKRFIIAALAYCEEADKWNDVAVLKTNCMVRFSKNTTVGDNFGKVKWSVVVDYLDKSILDKHESKGYVYTSGGGHWDGGKWIPYRSGDDFWSEWDQAKSTTTGTTTTTTTRTESTTVKESGTGATTGNLFTTSGAKTDETGEEKAPEVGKTEPEKVEEKAPVEKEVAPEATTFQYRPGSVRDQPDKRVSYEYWPLQDKVSRRETSTQRGVFPSYKDFRRGDLEYDSEITNCKRWLHNANGGVYITIDNDDYDITVHLPSGKVKGVEVMDPRWNGWYTLMSQMDTEWDRAVELAREKGSSNLSIRFYPWNAAHSFVSMNIGAYEDIDPNEDNEEPAPDPVTEVKEPVKPKRGRPSKAEREARALAAKTQGSDSVVTDPIDVSDLEVLPWTGKDDSIILPDWYEGFKREAWSLEEAQEFLKCGCANCQGTFDIDDKVYWHNNSTYFCNECIDTEVVQQHVDVKNLYLGQRKEA